MKRRTLDILFSAGGVALAVLFLILGLVMTSNANFSKKYVRDQLRQQSRPPSRRRRGPRHGGPRA